MSKSEQRERERQIIDEKRHATANIPMQLPDDAYEVVPGIYVASLKALPQLIEFFNVRTVVRCVEHTAAEREEDYLISLGGNAEHPYGDAIDEKHVFHAPIRDDIDECDFPKWASKAADFIAHVLHTEEEADQQEQRSVEEKEADKKEEEAEAAAAAAAAASEQKKKDEDDDDGGEKVSKEGEQEKQEAAAAAASAQEEQQQQAEEDDVFAAFRTRGPGNVVIHCEAGRSRSPAVAAAYLVLKRQMNLQEALEMFEGDEDSNMPPYKLQINPVFIMQLAQMESQVLGAPIFDLRAYWISRLVELFPKIPASTIATQLDAAQGNMIAAREQLRTIAARQFFDRDKLIIDALFDICQKTSEDLKAGINMRWVSADPVVSMDEVTAAYRDSGKKRDVALQYLTKTIKVRMTIE